MRSICTCLIIIFCFHSKIYAQVVKEKEPLWLDVVNFSKSEIDINDVTAGTHILLFDTQINIPKQIVFNRLTTKVTDNVGIQNASTINVSYDPSYQKLKFHKINIIRNNQIIDKLVISDIQVMRRELNAENHLYDGSLSAVMNISDVRTDDVIDYSYSIIGFNPIHKNIFSSHFYLNDMESYGKINITLLSQNELKHKGFNSSVEPTISKVNNLIKYNWVSRNTTKLDYEENTPVWKLIYESVSVTEFKTWKEVVNWGLDVYKINEPIGTELQAKIDEINSNSSTNGEKIKSTLNFVQNEIRYLGLESGIGSYKPFTPNQVFKQRFGDCKDKSLLMTTMLNKMNIEAYPMFVNTSLKQSIKELLPSPKLFDHCVVKVEDGTSHWYDPTITNQGGEHDSTYFPDYRFGLVLKKNNDSFDEIKPYSENKIKILEEYTIDEIGKGASLNVVSTYYEGEADEMRYYFKTNSINSIEKEYEKFYSNYYYNVTSLKSPRFEDNLNSNIFKVYEEYKLDSIWAPMVEKENYISATFTPSSLLNSLYIPTNDKRVSELAIAYPIIREHQIKINLPTDWGIENDNLFVNSPGFYYEWKVKYDRKQKIIDLHYYLKSQKDHITKSEYKQYIQDVKKIDQTTSYQIYIPENYSKTIGTTSNTNLFASIITIVKFSLTLCTLVILALFLFWYFNKKKSK
ncbi:DUF3857 domain-containing transglutaminase family protein [Mariniflexile sp. AS56]|uniref:DUF3857 domain-containing transglutaminase family protein n=1 Tax=Mariniflexile sp. AS56 TaxID=3063957 RepID=UPI0026F0FE86|nr:DUF3857 domain-containing transglutaminase family protein [Mariniflexile sp. AS56]MDO7172603.1 DUF3857 domain-containing transglutaminase family protein [Mariniflexile sp. AS56]